MQVHLDSNIYPEIIEMRGDSKDYLRRMNPKTGKRTTFDGCQIFLIKAFEWEVTPS